MAQDSSLPGFWDARCRGGVTPRDAAGVPARLEEFLDRRSPSRVLIPGCGAGYEVKAFAERGHDVLASDRAQLLRPGGALAGFFYLDDNERGPPFGISQERLDELLSAFRLEQDQAIPESQSIAVFKGKEVWQVWRRRL